MKKNIQTILLMAAAVFVIGMAINAGAKDHDHCQECKIAFGHTTIESYTFADRWK